MYEGHNLRHVSWILKYDHVVIVQADGPVILSLVKQILNDVHDTDVSLMTLLGKQGSYSLVRFVHQIVDVVQMFSLGNKMVR